MALGCDTLGQRRPQLPIHTTGKEMNKLLKSIVGALATCVAMTTASHADERYVATFIGSQHIGDDDLNNINPGVTLGRRWITQNPLLEFHAEAGVFFNSYEEVAPITLVGLSYEVGRIGPGAVRLGASAGAASYKELSRDLEELYGVPNLGGFIPIAAVTASYRLQDTELRLTTVPPGGDVVAILNLSIARSF